MLNAAGIDRSTGLGTFCFGVAFLFIAAVRAASGGGVGWQALVRWTARAARRREHGPAGVGGLVVPIVLVGFGVLLVFEASSGPKGDAEVAAALGLAAGAAATASIATVDDPRSGELVVGDDERRSEQDRVAVRAVGDARCPSRRSTPRSRPRARTTASVTRAARGNGARVSRSATSSSPTIRPAAADLADAAGGRRADRRGAPASRSPLRALAVDQVLVAQDPQDLAGDGRPDRRVRVREAVDEAGARRGDRRRGPSPDAATNPNGQ